MDREAYRTRIMSEEFRDFIVPIEGGKEQFQVPEFQRCAQSNVGQYEIVYIDKSQSEPLNFERFTYNSIPRCFALLDMAAMNQSGISQVQNYPVLELMGQNVMIGFVDTGIDYRNDIFRNLDGTTRIAAIWDQTLQKGEMPNQFDYGSEYTKEQINEALRNEEPLKIVPSLDTNGHGTFLASLASGSASPENTFLGAAPESTLAVVKLKQAKQYIKRYYEIPEPAECYQENDIMLAVNYVRNIALSMDMPISLCMTLGTNGRSHDGASALSYVLDRFASGVGAVVSLSTGDEGNKQLHGTNVLKVPEVTGVLPNQGAIDSSWEYSLVEIRVDERQKGLFINIWGSKPGVISVGLVSPTGEVIERVAPRIGKSEIYNLIFDATTVTIEYDLVEADSSDELIIIRLENPTPGIWSLRIYDADEKYNVYLPVSQFIYPNTYILEPSADITIVDPAVASNVITTSLYNARNGALYIDNGRGFGRDGSIKPDISSALSCAITAGAACQFLNWGIVEGKDKELRASDIKGYFIRGTIRANDISYPDRQWGYGKLDVYNSFEVIRG